MMYGRKQEKGRFSLIKCPYCFCEFPHDKVCFKAQTIFTKQDVERMGDDEVWDLGKEVGAKGAAVNRAVMEKFIEKEDREYKRFWEKYPNSEPTWEYKNYPVISSEDEDMLENGAGYRMDAGGFVFSVTDCFGRESRIRICPYCHNELPSSYGKYPVRIISVVGITSSGKTVYLSHLMHNFGKIMSWVGIAALKMGDSVDRFVSENTIAKDAFLPQGTPPEQLTSPLFYRIKNGTETYTMVFYDIAGENCIKPEKMEKYGPFVRNADGIILLVDPEQFMQLRENVSHEVLEPVAVLSAMSSAFLDADHEDGRSDKPLAVVISKSDILRKKAKNLISDNGIFNSIEYDKKKRFQYDKYRDLNGELRNLLSHLREGGELIENLRSCFNTFGLFAVSVLDGGVELIETETPQGEKIIRYKPINSPSGVRVEEPLFWMLVQMGILPQADDKDMGKRKSLLKKIVEYIRSFI